MDYNNHCGIVFSIRANVEPTSGRTYTFGSHYVLLQDLLRKIFIKENSFRGKEIKIYSLFYYRSQNFYTYTYSSYYLIEGVGYSEMEKLIKKYNSMMSVSRGSIGILYADSSLDNRILTKIGEIKIPDVK